MEPSSIESVDIRFEAVNPPDLCALQSGDETAWTAVFNWLWPTVFAVVQFVLYRTSPDQIEDVALETMEILPSKVCSVKSVEELRPLATTIAYRRAVSVLRKWLRGEGKREPFDSPKREPIFEKTPFNLLTEKELALRLRKSLAELKSPQAEILSDFYLDELCYQEIAQKRGVAIGSVGVHLKRGLEALRRIWRRGEKS